MFQIKAKVLGVQRLKHKENGTYAEVVVQVNDDVFMIRLWSENGFSPKKGDFITVMPPLSGVWRLVEDKEVK